MRILFISAWFPYPPSNGSKIRAFQFLRQLAARHQTTLVSFADADEVDRNPAALRDVCDSIRVVTRRPFQPNSPRSRRAFFGGTPRWLVDTRSPEMEQAIREVTAKQSFDVVIACQLPAAIYAIAIVGIPAIADEIDLGIIHDQFQDASGPAPRLRHGLTWWKHRRYLESLLPHFDACTVASARERDLLESSVPSAPDAHVVPNCLIPEDYADVQVVRNPDLLVFAGALSYFANRNGIEWFVSAVLPLINSRRPRTRLVVTGNPAGVRLVGGPTVEQVGHVQDVRPIIASASASIAPILEGGGTRLKILEAMALGTPVISTRKGAEGLDAVDGEHLLLADDSQQFADAVLGLLADRDLAQAVTANAQRLVAERHDWQIFGPRFEELVVDVATRSRRR